MESSNRTRKRVPGSEGAPDAGGGAQRGAGPRAGDQPRQHRRWECPAVDRARTHPWQRSGTEQLPERTARGTGRTGSLRLARVPLDQCDWEAMDRFGDRVVFQTEPWLQFIARSQRAEPVVAALRDGHATVGWFTGAIVRRCGVRILGSPFAGWGTQYLGFNLLPNVDRRAAWAALPDFAFESLRCHYVEVRCRHTGFHDTGGLGFERGRTLRTVTLDLRRSEAELWAGMEGSCRRCIKKAEREGVRIEEANALDFADEYYAQLVDVFARKNLKPLHDAERVRELIRSVHPSGHLLLLRALGPDSQSVATGIFPAMNGVAYMWGQASWREYHHLRVNEALVWHAIRLLRDRGIHSLDMGGSGDYKAKWGPEPTPVPSYALSRWRVFLTMRRAAEQAQRRLKGQPPVPPPFVPDPAPAVG